SAKNRFGKEKQQQQGDSHVHRVAAAPLPGRRNATEKKERSDDQISRAVAQPPCRPDCTIICPLRETPQGETGHAKNRTDQSAYDGGERELENVLGAIEDAYAAGKT